MVLRQSYVEVSVAYFVSAQEDRAACFTIRGHSAALFLGGVYYAVEVVVCAIELELPGDVASDHTAVIAPAIV